MDKLLDAIAREHGWLSAIVSYPLRKAVSFWCPNIITLVKYLLRHRAYEGDILWALQ